MDKIEVENLVICSTLNQITNYLIIEKYNPKKVFNITFDSKSKEKFNINIKNCEWDKWLENECKELDIEWNQVELTSSDIYDLNNLKNKLKENILDENKILSSEKIYWHVTGGQRIITLAINELIKEETSRKEDKLLYIEGNTEQVIIYKYKDNSISSESYGYEELTLEKILNLVGFNTKDYLESTVILKGKNARLDSKEHEFYKNLYEIIINDKDQYECEKKKGCFRDLLLKSNTMDNGKRKEFVKKLFNELFKKDDRFIKNKDSYNILDSEEMGKSYPAGYIFEKLTAHKIYDVIQEKDKKNRVIELRTSVKTYFDDESKKSGIIDELDIVLLTDTGKIINFECKSGGMKGDNAKSHNYTTYRLAGVFGMPVLLSPLYETEIFNNSNDKGLENQFQALKAAKAAELEVIEIDQIESKIGKLLNIDDK